MKKVHNNIFKMIEIIKKNKIVTIDKLSEELDVSESTIKRYKKIAKILGVNIKSLAGRNGGYYIEDNLKDRIKKTKRSFKRV